MSAVILPAPRFRRILATSVVLVVVLAGCSASGTDDSAGSSSTTAAEGTDQDETTTTGGTDPSVSTTTTGTDGRPVSRRALQAMLPAPDDIGPGYQVAAEEEDDPEDQAALEASLRRACPDAASLFETFDGKGREVERLFETADGRTISVKLNPKPRNLDEDTLDTAIDAINRCDPVTTEFDNGLTTTLDLGATRDDTYGERGVVLDLRGIVVAPQIPKPIQNDSRSRAFIVGSASVTIDAVGGLDEATLEAIPADYEIIDRLSASIERKLEGLVD